MQTEKNLCKFYDMKIKTQIDAHQIVPLNSNNNIIFSKQRCTWFQIWKKTNVKEII